MEINITPTPSINYTNIVNTNNTNANIPECQTSHNNSLEMCTSVMNSSKPTNNQTTQDYPFKPGCIFKGIISIKGNGKTTKTNCFMTIYIKKKIESLQRLFDLSKGLA